MQTTLTNRNTETVGTTRCPQPRLVIQLSDERRHQRNIRIAFSLRRRESCLTRRAMLAAMRDAEFQEWLDSGGDYLDSMHQSLD